MSNSSWNYFNVTYRMKIFGDLFSLFPLSLHFTIGNKSLRNSPRSSRFDYSTIGTKIIQIESSGDSILGFSSRAKASSSRLEQQEALYSRSLISCPHYQLSDGIFEACEFLVLRIICSQVVQDEKYFQRVNWQYMVLDEAQAIKSSSR